MRRIKGEQWVKPFVTLFQLIPPEKKKKNNKNLAS